MPTGWPALSPELALALQIRRALAAQARRKRRAEYRVPEQRFPHAAELAYMAKLKDLQKWTERALREAIFPNLNRVPTAPPEYITRLVDGVRFAVGERINIVDLDNLTAQVGEQLSLFNRREIGRQLEAVIGVDPLMSDPWIGEHLVTFRKENVNLIKSLHGTQLDDVENLLLRANRQGLRVEAIRDQIMARFGLSRQKAMLIARDQTGKLNGELTSIRQQAIGVQTYIWRTSKDERVRGSKEGTAFGPKSSALDHAALEGTKHRWDKAPVVNHRTGMTAHPGGDYQCRCRAEPNLEHILGDLTEQEKAQLRQRS